jgi:hypothetical protein
VPLQDSPLTFQISPIVRFTLFALYIALTLPLPFLAELTNAPTPPNLLWTGMAIGGVILHGALSERVLAGDRTLTVTYPRWFPFRKGWSLDWEEIEDLKLRTTGQGGLVYYLVGKSRDRAYLLPVRIAGFSRLVGIVEEKTGIDTQDIRPLAQPWMYFILLALSLILLAIDAWTIATARSLSAGV